jgi:hypothetical protein
MYLLLDTNDIINAYSSNGFANEQIAVLNGRVIEIPDSDFQTGILGCKFTGTDTVFAYEPRPLLNRLVRMEDELWLEIKDERRALLNGSDWTQTLDAPLTPEQQQAWKVWRQALRDLPSQYAGARDAQRGLDELRLKRPDKVAIDVSNS